MIALITGSGRGIGKAIAIAVASKGIHVILNARTGDQIKSVEEEIKSFGGKATAIACDITDSKSIELLRDEISTIGKVSLLINNAGIAPSAKIEDTTDEIWQKTFTTNADAPFNLIKTFLPDMKELGAGHIINIASSAAFEGFPYTSAYTASKHALLGLSRAIAKELARSQIKVSTICPGFVRTNMLEISIENIMTKTRRERSHAETELGKMNKSGKIIEPEEVAHIVLTELDMPLEPSGREIIL